MGREKEMTTACQWLVYILECSDRTLYTGITSDLKARLKKHSSGTGAKYTKGRGPFKVVYSERRQTKGLALKREVQIKKLSRSQKLLLISGRKNKNPSNKREKVCLGKC